MPRSTSPSCRRPSMMPVRPIRFRVRWVWTGLDHAVVPYEQFRIGCRRDHEPHSPCVRRGMSRSRLLVRSLAQSRKVDRKPWGTAATFIRRTTAESVISDSAPPRGAGNRRPSPSCEKAHLRERRRVSTTELCVRDRFSFDFLGPPKRQPSEAEGSLLEAYLHPTTSSHGGINIRSIRSGSTSAIPFHRRMTR